MPSACFLNAPTREALNGRFVNRPYGCCAVIGGRTRRSAPTKGKFTFVAPIVGRGLAPSAKTSPSLPCGKSTSPIRGGFAIPPPPAEAPPFAREALNGRFVNRPYGWCALYFPTVGRDDPARRDALLAVQRLPCAKGAGFLRSKKTEGLFFPHRAVNLSVTLTRATSPSRGGFEHLIRLPKGQPPSP